MLAACGGSSDDGSGGATPGGDDPAGGEVDLEQAGDVVDSAVADTSADAKATVDLDGTTYEFRAVEDPEDEWASFCTTIAGSVQGVLLLVDESGAVVEDGEVTFTLFEPDSAYATDGALQEVWLTLPPSETGISGPITYMSDGDTIESEVSGRSATATFTGRHHTGDLNGTIEASC